MAKKVTTKKVAKKRVRILGKCRWTWIQRFQKVYTICCTDGSRDSYKGSSSLWIEVSRCYG